MSRIAKQPIPVPQGVEIKMSAGTVTVKGGKTTLQHVLHPSVRLEQQEDVLAVSAKDGSREADMQAGTARALVNNMIVGVSQGFERKLELKGVGYRAQVQGENLNLTLGFSHPVVFPIPEGVSIEAPSQTELVIKGADKQQVGQVAANIRAYRPPEPYKGKGVRYADETVILKEAKKK